MRHELGHGPVEMTRVADGQPLRGKRFRLETRRQQEYPELDAEGAGGLVGRVAEIGQGGWTPRRPRRLRRPERRQRFGGDDPRRDGGEKALAEEWTQRLVFPRLDVARGPIVQQAEPRDVARRGRNGNRWGEVVGGGRPKPQRA